MTQFSHLYVHKYELDMVIQDVTYLKKSFTSLDYLVATITAMHQEQIKQGARLDRIEDNLLVLNTKMAVVLDNLATLNSDMTGVKDRLTSLESNMTEVKDRLTSLESNMAGVKSNLGLLNSDMSRVKKKLDIE